MKHETAGGILLIAARTAFGRAALRLGTFGMIWRALAVGAVIGGVAQPVRGQLSEDDIKRLQERGEREGWTFTVSLNEATRYSRRELCGAVPPADWRTMGPWDSSTPTRSSLPATFDWRSLGGCTAVRNQANCGSCWAFAAMGTVESFLLIQRGLDLNLSEQWLINCTTAGNCEEGGWHSTSYEYLKCNGLQDPCGGTGVVLESHFPYTATDGPCNCPYSHPYCIPGWYFIGPEWGVPTVDQIKQAILLHGPVSVCCSVNDAFQAYDSGVFNNCEDGGIDHVVDLVGWDDYQGANGVWFMRNSWGAGWGEAGYMRIEYGCSLIGYAAAYVDYLAEPGMTSLPFSDQFPAITFDSTKWTGIQGAEVNVMGMSEPSAPYSVDLGGSSTGGDALRSANINTTGLADIIISYHWQRRGSGDSPETGDDLIVEYNNSGFNWVELARYSGSGEDMTTFSPASHTLYYTTHPDAFHGRFRLQFRVSSSEAGGDDYFIDDVSLITTTDQTPPADLHWVTVPTPISTTAITMEAFASDPSGVEYYFDATGAGSADRTWNANPGYTNSGLQVNRNYTYRVKARDGAVPTMNETAYTDNVSLATFIETPTALTFGTVTQNAIVANAPGTFTRLATSSSGLYFEVLDPADTPVGGSQANAWVKVQTITAAALLPGTTYRFRVKARNYFGVNETPWYPASGYLSQPTQYAACGLAGDVNQDGLVNGLDVDGFIRARLGGQMRSGENPNCASYGGTLEQDIEAFAADLLEA